MTIGQLETFVTNHAVELIGGIITFDVVGSSMPVAGPDSPLWYRFLYGILQLAARNFRNMLSAWVPQLMAVPGFAKAVSGDTEALKAAAAKAGE